MPFDPTKPAFGSPDSSAEMRAQLNALNDKIDATPAGPAGAQGPPGPPFASTIVEPVATLNPGEPATVSTLLDGNNVRFTFGIPRGNDGNQGPQGPSGEVSNAALAAAIAGTSANTNGVALLGMTVSDPPTQAQMQAIANKLDELIAAQRR